jgi:signal transduction histidine kinase
VNRNKDLATSLDARGGNRVLALLLFVALYAVLVATGYALKEDLLQLTILWPAAGLLLVTLYYAPLRMWLAFLAAQIVAEIAVGYVITNGYARGFSPLFPLANLADGVVGALLARRFIPDAALPRLRQVAAFIVASSFGAAAGALIGAAGAVNALSGQPYWREWQLWWAGNWLGSLTFAPLVMTWAVRFAMPERAASPAKPLELLCIGAAVLLLTGWIFSTRVVDSTVIVLPYVLLVGLTVAAFRLPPRWATSLCTAAILIAAVFASNRVGPFSFGHSPFSRVLSLQLFLAVVAIYTFGLSTVLLEKRRLLGALSTSDDRYKNYVRHSSEAVWRIELGEPMPMNLPVPAQIEWLKSHAYVAECSSTYEMLHARYAPRDTPVNAWLSDVPWAGILMDSLQRVATHEYVMQDLAFTVRKAGSTEHWVANFHGVLEDGKLLRIWGVARNVSDMVRANERLRLGQQRLRDFANQLSQAEERARRATAVDLHDGIGQLMTAAAHTMEVAARQAGGAVAKLIGEALDMMRKVQGTTRDVIADLSPPGLYDLGLQPALQWLSLRFRSQYQLEVEVDVNLHDSIVDLELRIVAFKIVRELLQNVAKHARVNRARVIVQGFRDSILVEVIDQGVGFEWQYELFESNGRGFGLWSIDDRVRAAGGEMTVDTAPGKGCRVTVSFPLDVNRDSRVA